MLNISNEFYTYLLGAKTKQAKKIIDYINLDFTSLYLDHNNIIIEDTGKMPNFVHNYIKIHEKDIIDFAIYLDRHKKDIITL